MIRINPLERLARHLLASARAYRAETRLSACRGQVEDAGIWFIDIPRTGSTSLKLALAEHFGSEFGKSYVREDNRVTAKVIGDHTTAVRARQILSPELWNRLFTFTIVRNPWDRCYSMFRYRIADKEIPADFPFSEYLMLLERKNTRHPYTPFLYPPYFIPMCDFVLDGEGRQLVNYIGRFEQREELMLVLKEKTGVDFSGLRRAEVLGQPGDYKKAYCNKGVEIIARIYRDDVERFGYDF